MTVLYVMSEHPSVSQTFVETEAAALHATGVQVVAYALARGAATASPEPVALICPPPSRARLVVTGLRTLTSSARAVWRARRVRPSWRELVRLLLAQAHAEYAWPYVKAAGVTHIHAHFLVRPADVAAALAEKLASKWTVTSHGADAYAPREPALLRRRLDGTAGVACANGRVQDALVLKSKRAALPTRVIHCGVDTRALKVTGGPKNGGIPHIVTIGRLVATKGHWTSLAAADALMRRYPAARWTIVGGGPLFDALRADPRYRALSPRLVLAGPMDHRAALEVLARATAFVLPCERDQNGGSDGIPVALMEAMALGVPVVTTNVGGISELVLDGVTGFVVAPRDSDAVARVLETILSRRDEPALESVKRSARLKVEQEFEISRESERLAQFLKEVGARLGPP